MEIILATQNKDKISEIRDILSSDYIKLRILDEFGDVPEIIEDGKTLEENALKKARTIRSLLGISALADDTGLEVKTLGGAPGVYSSRYAGENATYEDNCLKLLETLSGVPAGERTARFRCVMALALDGKSSEAAHRLAESLPSGPFGTERREDGQVDAFLTEGIVDGQITTSPRGTSGFGYDPVFEHRLTGKTFAEMGISDKNRLSHRYRALVEMRELLIRLGSKGRRSKV